MKKIFFFCFLMLGAMVTFNACGDEDNKPNTNQGADDNTPSVVDDVNTVATYSQKKDGSLVMNISTNSTILDVTTSNTTEWECKFDAENKLTSSVRTITFANAALANAAYEGYMREKDPDDQTVYAVQGNKITIDDTANRRGTLKQQIMQEMQIAVDLANKNQHRPNSNDSIPGYVVPQDSVPGHVTPTDSVPGYVEPGDSLKPIIPIDSTDVTPIVNRTTASVKYSSNYMTLTIDNGQYQTTTACEFAERGDQNVCIKATQIYYFTASGQRQEEDITEDYAGGTFEEILAQFQAIADQINNQSNGEFF